MLLVWKAAYYYIVSVTDPQLYYSLCKDELDPHFNWKRMLKLGHYFLVKPLVSICAEAGVESARLIIQLALEAFQIARLYDQKNMMDKIGDLMAK